MDIKTKASRTSLIQADLFLNGVIFFCAPVSLILGPAKALTMRSVIGMCFFSFCHSFLLVCIIIINASTCFVAREEQLPPVAKCKTENNLAEKQFLDLITQRKHGDGHPQLGPNSKQREISWPGRDTKEIEDITWPRGDNKFLF